MLGFLLEVRYASFKAQANIQLKESCMCGVHICITTVLCERFDVQTQKLSHCKSFLLCCPSLTLTLLLIHDTAWCGLCILIQKEPHQQVQNITLKKYTVSGCQRVNKESDDCSMIAAALVFPSSLSEKQPMQQKRMTTRVISCSACVVKWVLLKWYC